MVENGNVINFPEYQMLNPTPMDGSAFDGSMVTDIPLESNDFVTFNRDQIFSIGDTVLIDIDFQVAIPISHIERFSNHVLDRIPKLTLNRVEYRYTSGNMNSVIGVKIYFNVISNPIPVMIIVGALVAISILGIFIIAHINISKFTPTQAKVGFAGILIVAGLFGLGFLLWQAKAFKS